MKDNIKLKVIFNFAIGEVQLSFEFFKKINEVLELKSHYIVGLKSILLLCLEWVPNFFRHLQIVVLAAACWQSTFTIG